MSTWIRVSLLFLLSLSKLHYFVLSSGISECNWQGKIQRTEPREDWFHCTNIPKHLCVVHHVMATSAHWCQVYTDGTLHPNICGFYRQAAPSTSELILLPWILWWYTTLPLWRRRQPTQSQKSILLLFSTLSTWINLHWLIKRLKISHALSRMETNNAKQVSKCSITWGVGPSLDAQKADRMKWEWWLRIHFFSFFSRSCWCVTSKAALRCGNEWLETDVLKYALFCSLNLVLAEPVSQHSQQCNTAPVKQATWHLQQGLDFSHLPH